MMQSKISVNNGIANVVVVFLLLFFGGGGAGFSGYCFLQ